MFKVTQRAAGARTTSPDTPAWCRNPLCSVFKRWLSNFCLDAASDGQLITSRSHSFYCVATAEMSPPAPLVSGLMAFLLSSARFTICHKTEVMKNTLNPVWQTFSIPVRALCNGDYDR